MATEDHFTRETEGKIGTILTPEEAAKAHHLATADPEPERDGLMTGPAHEEKYGLERAERSAQQWRDAGVHPTENRALVEGDEGFTESVVEISTTGPVVVGGEVREKKGATEKAVAPKTTETRSK